MKKQSTRPVPSQYDLRPYSMRSPDLISLEKLRVDLLGLNNCCVLCQLLIPPVEIALRDHNYYSNGVYNTPSLSSTHSDSRTLEDINETLQKLVKTSHYHEKLKLNVSPIQRMKIEMTICQSLQADWFAVRARRITGSKCGKIITQKERTDALLVSLLYAKPMDREHLPKPIKWGIERHAREAYVEYK